MGKQMKIEMEIPEAEIIIAAEAGAKKAVMERVTNWRAKDEIISAVNRLWSAEIDAQVARALINSDQLQQQINAAIERKLRSKIEMLMRKSNQ